MRGVGIIEDLFLVIEDSKMGGLGQGCRRQGGGEPGAGKAWIGGLGRDAGGVGGGWLCRFLPESFVRMPPRLTSPIQAHYAWEGVHVWT